MRADEITGGDIYADVNALYMFLRRNERHRVIIRPFMKHVVQGKIELYVSPLTTDELLYRLLLTRIKEVYGRNPHDVLRSDPIEPIRRLSDEISHALQRTLRLPHIRLVSIATEDIFQMLENTQQYALMPRDALHLAVMQRLGLRDIVSDDADFDRIPELRRHWVLNVPDNPL